MSGLLDGPPVVRHVDDLVYISALAPLTRVIAELDGVLPGLDALAWLFASVRIRNRATIGGNLANASPAGDTIPPLVAGGCRRRPGGHEQQPPCGGCRSRDGAGKDRCRSRRMDRQD